MISYEKIIRETRPADQKARAEAAQYIDGLIKPIGSLGKLEELAVQIAGITGKVHGNDLKKRTIVVMCADNGVFEEGIASAPQEVTILMARAMAAGKSGMTVLAHEAGSDCTLVDIGINSDEPIPGLLMKKIAKGTANFTKGPAMTREMCVRAVETGIGIVCDLKDEGYAMIGTGELGMGNTTSSACVLMGLTGISADLAVGKGAGLTEEGYENKKRVARLALSVNRPDPDDPIDVLTKVGGLDIAGLVGVYLGAAYCRIPVVIDGFISAVAALAAARLCPDAARFMIPSHASTEPGFALAMKELKKEPMLFMDMRLGEGSGCPLAFHLIDSVITMIEEMATFEEASIDGTSLVDIRENQ